MARSTDDAVCSTRMSTFGGGVVAVTGGFLCAPLTPVRRSRLVNPRAVSPAFRSIGRIVEVTPAARGAAPSGGVEVAIDHAVHVEDIALLARVEAEGLEAPGLHADLHFGEVCVVLVGDLAPVLGRPVGVVPAFGH